jgi:gentisate 1,2-dioxygenase
LYHVLKIRLSSLVVIRVSKLILAFSEQAFYVIHGKGYSTTPAGKVSWSAGDLFVVPAGGQGECVHTCVEDDTGGAGLYWVNDAPLLSYLGVEPKVARFEPAFFR